MEQIPNHKYLGNLDHKSWRVKFYQINRWVIYADFYESSMLVCYEFYETDELQYAKYKALKQMRKIIRNGYPI